MLFRYIVSWCSVDYLPTLGCMHKSKDPTTERHRSSADYSKDLPHPERYYFVTADYDDLRPNTKSSLLFTIFTVKD